MSPIQLRPFLKISWSLFLHPKPLFFPDTQLCGHKCSHKRAFEAKFPSSNFQVMTAPSSEMQQVECAGWCAIDDSLLEKLSGIFRGVGLPKSTLRDTVE